MWEEKWGQEFQGISMSKWLKGRTKLSSLSVKKTKQEQVWSSDSEDQEFTVGNENFELQIGLLSEGV